MLSRAAVTLVGFVFGAVMPAIFGNSPTPAQNQSSHPIASSKVLDPKLPTVFIAGDSTAAKNNGQPIQGWAEPFAHYFDLTKVNIMNYARGGRSSRTFINEGWWDQLLSAVKPGDLVLIQFGHNDTGAINEEPPGSTRPLRARGSLPGLGNESQAIVNALTQKPETVYTFGSYIRKMVTDVKAKGATPLLLSPTVRDIWSDRRVERGVARYREWDREIANQAGVTFVDLTRIIADEYQELGEQKVKAFFPQDHTHVNDAGADFNAQAVVAGLKGIHDGPFSKWLSLPGQGVAADSIGWLNLPEPQNPALPSLILIGDSTVRNGRGDGAGGQWGWGDSLAQYFDLAKINLVNRAVGGLSSRTFLTQKHWAHALTLLKRGDYLLIQFGHNDDGPLNDLTRARGTIKGTGEETEEIDNQLTRLHETVHSYGWYLRLYIREAKARGVTPILCTPIPRKTWDHGHIALALKSYPSWARQVAEEESIELIDLNQRITELYNKLGEANVEPLFADPHTHTSRAGADLNAAVVVEGLKALPSHPLVTFFSAKAQSLPNVSAAPSF